MKAKYIAELINAYNVYRDGKRIGVEGEVELPELEMLAETTATAGMLGEIDVPALGHFGSMKTKLKFTILSDDYFTLMNTKKELKLVLRADGEFVDKKTTLLEHFGIKIVVCGWVTNANLGSLEQGKKSEAEIEVETTYLKVVIDGDEKLVIDKLNFKYEVDGKDQLAKVRKNI